MTSRNGHPSEEDLILHFYGESAEPASIHKHLAACRECASEFAAITQTLTMVAAPVPPRGDLYGLEVWQRIRPQLPAREPWTRFLQVRWSTVTFTAAIAVFTIVAFVAGRYWPSPHGPASVLPRVANLPWDGDERARNVAVIDHLERSERVLLDLSNVDGPDGDVSVEQAWAADLVDANRLIREAATQAGETTTASVLEDLERSLLDIVHAPSKLTPSELDEVRARLDAAALLFKVRVLSNELRERETAPVAPRKTT